MKKNILITGGAGFIGFHFARELLKRGYFPVIVDNLNDYYESALKEARISQLEGAFDFVKADISDYKAMEELFEQYVFDKVCHFAAQAGVRYSLENPFLYISSNIVGLVNILELCAKKGIKKFIFASSSSVYGENKKVPFSEKDKTDFPVSLYGATKKSGEEIIYSYHKLFGINCTILRFFTVYGPWGRPDMAHFIFAKNIIEEKSIKVFNNGKMERDFTYIDDAISGIIFAFEESYPYEIFNIGNNNPVQLGYLINCLERKIGRKAIKEYLPLQSGDVIKTWADIEKAEKLLGFKPKFSIEQGIEKFINWYRSYYKY